MKSKHRIAAYGALCGVIALVSALMVFFPQLRQFSSPEFVKTFVLNFGSVAFLVYVILVAATIPLPVPSIPFILAGGYIFGTPVGMALALSSTLIGSSISFFFTRLSGRPFVEKFVDKHHLKHFDIIFKKRGKAAALLSYALPIFPSDTISLLLGLTNIRYRTFLGLVFLGHIPRLYLINVFGASLRSGFTVQNVSVAVMLILLVLTAVFRENVKRCVFNELSVLKKDVHLLAGIFK